jgi:ketosteroid isomerase-like protein
MESSAFVQPRDTAWAMSQENVEVVRRITDAFVAGSEHGEYGAAWDTGLVAEDFEWVGAPEMAEETRFRGRQGFVEAMKRWTEDFDQWSIHLEQLVDAANDRVLGFFNQTATGKGSGVPVKQEYSIVYDFRDGQVVRMRLFLDRADALEAAGLSE